jgi:hypothetical protein
MTKSSGHLSPQYSKKEKVLFFVQRIEREFYPGLSC